MLHQVEGSSTKIHQRRRDLRLGKLWYGASRTINCPKILAISNGVSNSQEMEFTTIYCREIRKKSCQRLNLSMPMRNFGNGYGRTHRITSVEKEHGQPEAEMGF